MKEMAIIRNGSSGLHQVHGPTSNEPKDFVSFIDAHNYVVRSGFGVMLDGDEEKFWRAKYTSLGLTAKIEALYYRKSA